MQVYRLNNLGLVESHLTVELEVQGLNPVVLSIIFNWQFQFVQSVGHSSIQNAFGGIYESNNNRIVLD